jgi:hypothetical protein
MKNKVNLESKESTIEYFKIQGILCEVSFSSFYRKNMLLSWLSSKEIL